MEYIAHLQKDKKFSALLESEPHVLQLYKNIPVRLMASIMSQQLSTAVARVIFKRFLELFNGKEPSPEEVLAIAPENLRAIGLSNAKVQYIRNVALFARSIRSRTKSCIKWRMKKSLNCSPRSKE